MFYKALISFSGKISMTMGEVKEISDDAIAKDLLRAGYIEAVGVVEETKLDVVEEPKKKKAKKDE